MADVMLRAPPRDRPLIEGPTRHGNERPLRALRLPIGVLIYLAALGIVAAATTAVFFGSGFFLLMNAPAETADGDAKRGPAPIPTLVQPPTGTSALAPAPPTTPAAERTALPPKPAGMGPKGRAEAPSEPGPGTPTEPNPTAAPQPSASTPMPAAEIARLLARGDALFHDGDAASARFFYQQAVDAGDSEAALRIGMTFDPVFATHRARRKWRSNPAAARFWYRRALDLGAAGAQRQLDQFELNQLVRKSDR